MKKQSPSPAVLRKVIWNHLDRAAIAEKHGIDEATLRDHLGLTKTKPAVEKRNRNMHGGRARVISKTLVKTMRAMRNRGKTYDQIHDWYQERYSRMTIYNAINKRGAYKDVD